MSLKFTEDFCVMKVSNDAKFEEELTCRFKFDMTNLTNFDSSTQKSKKFARLWAPFIQSRKCMSLKFKEELCVTTMKNDTKREEEFTCHFQSDMRKLTNFDPSTKQYQNIAL